MILQFDTTQTEILTATKDKPQENLLYNESVALSFCDTETLQNTYEQEKNIYHLPDSVMLKIKVLRLVEELKSIWIIYLCSILIG